MLIDCREEHVVYPHSKVVILEAATLLLFPVETRKEEVERDILESDQAPKRVMWDLGHWPPNAMSARRGRDSSRGSGRGGGLIGDR